MRGLTLNEIQQESLKILEYVHSFCVENDIHYSLAYGTLIGAIRHQGFIPWDDDIDIMMPRPDYDMFCKKYHSEKFKLVCSENDESCLIGFARVCECEKTSVGGSSWTKNNVGVWIDIFPVDGIEDDRTFFFKRLTSIRKKWYFLWRLRVLSGSVQNQNSRLMNFAISLKKFRFIDSFYTHLSHLFVRMFINQIKSVPFSSSMFCSQLSCPDNGDEEKYKSGIFQKYLQVPFEDCLFYIVEDYDSVLGQVYGDYMQLPPVDQRAPKQDYLNFYWK